MRVTGTVGEDNRIILPEDTVTKLGLAPGSRVHLDIVWPLDEEEKRKRLERVTAALDEFRGSMRQDMLDQGYASVDEMMNDIRPPW